MFQKTENSNSVMPEAIERSGDIVIVRKNFVLVAQSDEKPAHYEYDEWQMTVAQYDVYEMLQGRMQEQEDALVELGELFAEQDDALVELAEMIGG